MLHVGGSKETQNAWVLATPAGISGLQQGEPKGACSGGSALHATLSPFSTLSSKAPQTGALSTH